MAARLAVSPIGPPKLSRLTDEELLKIEEKLPALVDVCAHAARALPPTTKMALDEDVLEDLQRVTGPHFRTRKMRKWENHHMNVNKQ